jgi:hypothetical protein
MQTIVLIFLAFSSFAKKIKNYIFSILSQWTLPTMLKIYNPSIYYRSPLYLNLKKNEADIIYILKINVQKKKTDIFSTRNCHTKESKTCNNGYYRFTVVYPA